MAKNEIVFRNPSASIDRFLTEEKPKKGEQRTVTAGRKCSKRNTFPSNRFRKLGASVSVYNKGWMVDFSRVIVASTVNEDFIEKMLVAADEEGVVNVPDNSSWGVKMIGPRRFYIYLKSESGK